jgi:simple sugar transport system substrate-binding protein
MSDTDQAHEAVERLEFAERPQADRPGFDRRAFLRRTALTGVAAGSVGSLLSACGSSASSSSNGGASSIFGSSKSYKFTFVNHVTTNPFFVPTQYGIQDACKLLGCSFQWTGSESSNVSQMVNAVNTAVSAGVDGIAVSLVDETAFNAPVQSALSAGIPVLAYNADAKKNARLAYIGQDLEVSGEQMGEHIASLVPSGEVALFIATPGALNIQPRIDGALKTLKSHSSITSHTVATGAAVPAELTVIDSYITGHPNTKGMFAVDAGSTQGVAQTIQKHGLAGKVQGGGYDLLEVTEQLLAKGDIQFTIDQQPYLQGFLPIVELYLYQASKKLSGIADVDTGLKFLTKELVGPYNSTKSRYEGTATAAGVS